MILKKLTLFTTLCSLASFQLVFIYFTASIDLDVMGTKNIIESSQIWVKCKLIINLNRIRDEITSIFEFNRSTGLLLIPYSLTRVQLSREHTRIIPSTVGHIFQANVFAVHSHTKNKIRLLHTCGFPIKSYWPTPPTYPPLLKFFLCVWIWFHLGRCYETSLNSCCNLIHILSKAMRQWHKKTQLDNIIQGIPIVFAWFI